MALKREELLSLAATVGLVLGVDFEKNISNANLQKKIEEKQEELAMALKGSDSTDATLLTDNFDKEEERLSVTLKALEDGNLKEEDLSDYDKELLSKHRQGIDEALGVPKESIGTQKEIDTKFGDMTFVLNPTDEQIRSTAVALAMKEDTSIDDIKSFFKGQGVEQEKIDLIDFDDVFKEAEMLVEQNKQAHTPVLGEFGNLITDKKKIEELETGRIVITSICADFKKEATSYAEANEFTGVSIVDIKSNAANGTMINGFKFKIMK